MHVLSFISSLLTLFFAWYLLPLVYAKSYFVVQTPGQGVQWSNNAINPITWEKSLLDGVSSTDIELARMSSDGLIFIAKDVSASSSTGAINLFIQDIPTGDDYYLLFLNSTHGVMYGASQRFSISDTGNGTAPTPAAGAPTVTISGGPNPTVGFATTFPPNPNGVSALKTVGGAQMRLMSLVSVVAVCALGGAWTVL